MEVAARSRRLFFALWPDDEVRSQIVRRFSQLKLAHHGRVLRTENLHMTLHFLGQVSELQMSCMRRAAQSVVQPRFRLRLDCFDQFTKARVFWMGATEVPQQLRRLQQSLGAAIEDCDFSCERRPFTPHLTLMRKGRIDKDAFSREPFNPVIDWPVEYFALVESVPDGDGVLYQVIEKYPLS